MLNFLSVIDVSRGLHLAGMAGIGLHEAARQSLVVREERDTALKPEASSADCRVLALLWTQVQVLIWRGLIHQMHQHRRPRKPSCQGSFEVVIVDTSLADDWPVDVAEDLSNRIDRPFALLLLFDRATIASSLTPNQRKRRLVHQQEHCRPSRTRDHHRRLGQPP